MMKYNKDEIINFYENLDRSFFMDKNKEYADIDSPFRIGYGQTISQPTLVLKMTILLELEEKSKVLEIGTGSGYQTALISEFSKKVYTVERIKPLLEKAKERLDEAGYNNIHYRLSDGSLGWKEFAPYDRIIVTAASTVVPEELIDQLATEGRMIIPVGPVYLQDLKIVKKDSKGKISEELVEKVRFVRLIGKYE